MPRMASAPPMARATTSIRSSASGAADAVPCSAAIAAAAIAARRSHRAPPLAADPNGHIVLSAAAVIRSVFPGERTTGHRKARRLDPRAQLFGIARLLGELCANFGQRQHAAVDRHVALDVDFAMREVVLVRVAPEIDFPVQVEQV